MVVWRRSLLLAGLCLLVCGTFQPAVARTGRVVPPARPEPAASTQAADPWTRAKMPLDFVENRGQWGVPARFVAQKGSLAAAFDDNAIRLRLGSAQSALGLTFECASQDATLVG